MECIVYRQIKQILHKTVVITLYQGWFATQPPGKLIPSLTHGDDICFPNFCLLTTSVPLFDSMWSISYQWSVKD